MAEPDPLETLFAAAAARAAAPLDAAGPDHVRAAIDAAGELSSLDEATADALARDAFAPVLPRLALDAAALAEAMRDDPARPGLERDYLRLLDELGRIAAVYVGPGPDEGAEYREVCGAIAALRAASLGARPAWEALWRSGAAVFAARGRPPPRRPPQTPRADDREYYIA